MKQIYSLLALFYITLSFAQIPAGYYSTATGTGYTLKTQLYNIIKGHTDRGYAGLWTTYATSDRDNQYENDNTIIDIYSENPTGTDPYTYILTTNQCGAYSGEGSCYNREHIIPQSTFGTAAPMVSDAHFITPTDGKVNGQRSNFPHGMVTSPTWISLNGSKLGPNSNTGIAAGYTGTVFEPIDEFKGDIARMYFYFATRYENTVAGYPFDMFNSTSDQVFTATFLAILLAWDAQDPVSAREIARNNAIYARQNNRNPYIDHPEYVQRVWNLSTDITAPTAPTSLAVTGTTTTTVSLSWIAATDAVGVTAYDVYMDGVLKTTVTGVTATIPNLNPSTTYAFYIIAKDAALNSSVASSTVNGTTTADSVPPTAPTMLTITGTTSTTVSLTWLAATDAGGVTGYDIYVNGILTTSATGLNVVIPGLAPSTTYSFYVKAKDATPNYSPDSNIVNTTTAALAADTTAPAAPINLKITGVTGNSISLSWDASTDNIGVTQYDVYMDSGYETTVTGLTATITGVTFSGTIAFNIIAKDAAGNSSPWVCH